MPRTRVNSHRLAALALVLAVGLGASAVAAASASAATCADAHLVPSRTNLSRVATATLCLINQQRTTRGLPRLHPKPALEAAATAHSQDMVARGYFDHVSPAGVSPLARISRAGYLRAGSGYSIGENIAAATGSATPTEIVNMWMHSAGHRANILNPVYRDTGVGVASGLPSPVGSGPGATYTEDFGTII
jgi:uncharacterized protein YkwD